MSQRALSTAGRVRCRPDLPGQGETVLSAAVGGHQSLPFSGPERKLGYIYRLLEHGVGLVVCVCV